MKRQKKLSQSLALVSLVTLLLLSVPFVAMQFSLEVNWSLADFIIAGILIFITGLSYVLLTRSSSDIVKRIAVAFAIGSTFFLVWANLAVGLIGSGPNAANLMYIGIVAIVVIGTFVSRSTAEGMERVMFTAAIALVLVAVIQLLGKMYEYRQSSAGEVIGVNAFFAALFVVSGLLFRLTQKHLRANTNR